MSDTDPSWEHVQEDKDRETTRLPVDSGWLYCVTEKGDMGGILRQHVTFVPDPDATHFVEISYCDDDMLEVILRDPPGSKS